MPRRPIYVRVGLALRDYAKRVWDNAGEDNIFFLAGGIAFNILLAVVPFVLLLVSGFATLLKHSADQTFADVTTIIDSLLPPHAETNESPVHALLIDIIRARGAIGIYSAVGFIWFSTRLFGSLRSVLADVFDIETDRGIIAGKLFDIQITIMLRAQLAVTLGSTSVEVAERARCQCAGSGRRNSSAPGASAFGRDVCRAEHQRHHGTMGRSRCIAAVESHAARPVPRRGDAVGDLGGRLTHRAGRG